MPRALGRKKLEFVDGFIPVPIDSFDPLFLAWNRGNMLNELHNSLCLWKMQLMFVTF